MLPRALNILGSTLFCQGCPVVILWTGFSKAAPYDIHDLEESQMLGTTPPRAAAAACLDRFV